MTKHSRDKATAQRSQSFPTQSHWIYRRENFLNIESQLSRRVCKVVGSELTINHSVPSWFSRANARCTPSTEWFVSLTFWASRLALAPSEIDSTAASFTCSPHPAIGLDADTVVPVQLLPWRCNWLSTNPRSPRKTTLPLSGSRRAALSNKSW